jgi:hypothetical protein
MNAHPSDNSPAPVTFWPRLARAIAMLGAAVAMHLWLGRVPATHPPALPQSVDATAERTAAPRDASLTIVHEHVFAPNAGQDTFADSAPRGDAAAQPVMLLVSTAKPAAAAERAVGTSGITLPVDASANRPGTTLPELPPIPAGLLVRNPGNPVSLPTLQPAMLPSGGSPPAYAASIPAARRGVHAADFPSQQQVVLEVVRQYTRAYERLDVRTAKALRPSLDDRALQRAFQKLDRQEFHIASCDVSIRGQAANARCLGDMTYRPKFGSGEHHLPDREWTFNLSRNDSGWQIVDATIQ